MSSFHKIFKSLKLILNNTLISLVNNHNITNYLQRVLVLDIIVIESNICFITTASELY